MRQSYNIYCDESCHLETDESKFMVLGAVWCAISEKQKIFERIREIKQKHKFKPNFEIKWNKVSARKVAFYKEIIDYFFDDHDLHFRALVIPDKKKLIHEVFDSTHDAFYYKMYFNLLKVILEPDCSYKIYLDIKDTRSQSKVDNLKEVLRNSHYDFSKQIIKEIQQVRSHEVEILQLTDLLIGAVCYTHRGLKSNKGKLDLIEKIKHRSGYSMMHSTLYKEEKLNIFIWKEQSQQNA